MGDKKVGNQQRFSVQDIVRFCAGVCISFGCIVFIILSIPVYLFRQLVIFSAKYFRPELGNILNGQSSTLVNELFYDRPLRSNILVTTVARGKITLDEANELVTRNWIEGIDSKSGKLKFPQFQQYPVRWLGFTFYKKATNTFKLENHIHFHENLTGKGQVTEKELNEFSEKLLNESFKKQTSPWEFHIIKNYVNPELCSDSELSAVIFKVHHSLCDGFGILAALIEGVMEYPLSNIKIPVPKYPKRTTFEKLMSLILFPYNFIKEGAYILSRNFRDGPWKVPDDRKEWYQYCMHSDSIPIQNVVDIKNSLGISFSSVLVSAISAAIDRHFENGRIKANLPDTSNRSFQENMMCASVLPLAGHSMNLTNHVTVALFDIPTGEYSNPLERLHHCYDRLESTRTSISPRLAHFFGVVMGCHFYKIGGPLSRNRSVSAGLTNFPSLPIPIAKNGKLFLRTDFLVGGLEGTLGAAVTVMSYGQHIRIGVTCEKAVMSKKELETFVKDITEEIDTLYDKTVRNPKPLTKSE